MNRAVKTYLRYEDDALRLVDVAEEFEAAKGERQRAIEDLVRMAKCLPGKEREIQEKPKLGGGGAAHGHNANQTEKDALDRMINQLGKSIAVLEGKIQKGEETHQDYVAREIGRKATELETLPKLREEKRLAEGEYAALTAKYDTERERKDQMLANVQQGWAELSRQYEQRRAETERASGHALEQLNGERTEIVSALDEEQRRAKSSFASRRAGLEYARTKLNDEFRDLAAISEPQELKKATQDMGEKQRKQREEEIRLQGLRGESVLQKEKRERAREKIDQQAEAERSAWQTKIDQTKAQRDRAAEELEKFDESLARFFQIESPETWPGAAKALARETLFHNAQELEAKTVKRGTKSAWGVEFSTEKLRHRPPATIGTHSMRSCMNCKRLWPTATISWRRLSSGILQPSMNLRSKRCKRRANCNPKLTAAPSWAALCWMR